MDARPTKAMEPPRGFHHFWLPAYKDAAVNHVALNLLNYCFAPSLTPRHTISCPFYKRVIKISGHRVILWANTLTYLQAAEPVIMKS